MSNSLWESYIHVFYENKKDWEKVFGKTFFKKLLFYFFFIFVNYMNVAFQQAIGPLLTPSGRGERAI